MLDLSHRFSQKTNQRVLIFVHRFVHIITLQAVSVRCSLQVRLAQFSHFPLSWEACIVRSVQYGIIAGRVVPNNPCSTTNNPCYAYEAGCVMGVVWALTWQSKVQCLHPHVLYSSFSASSQHWHWVLKCFIVLFFSKF